MGKATSFPTSIPTSIGREDSGSVPKRSLNGIALIPRPTDDPKDPLNWTLQKKIVITAALCLAAFAGTIAPLSSQLNLVPQAKLYHKTTTQESYANSVALAGMAGGPFLFTPISHRLGRSSVIFWSLIGALACQIWGAFMTHSSQYIAFLMSRLFAGVFGVIPAVIGPRILIDLFFLHQRGRAFTALHLSFLFGTIAGPTFSGFISADTTWPVEFWWTIGLLGGVIVVVFTTLEETGFDRNDTKANVQSPELFVKNRIATFFFGNRVVPRTSFSETSRVAAVPFLIGASPVTLIMGIFTLVSFGFYVGINTLTPVWLQKPEKAGGYGFTLKQNAAFTFCHWIGIIVVQIYSHLIADRLPLFLCAHGKREWRPEFRLHALWLPSLILNPIGLGLFGATLQYHFHYLVLALAVFLVTIGSLASVPVIVNYIVESFTHYPAEAGIVIGAYRLLFGLTIPFYINGWVERVGVGWVYGMMAFFAVFSFSFVVLLMWKGQHIRRWQIARVSSSEEGEVIIEKSFCQNKEY